MLRSIRFKKDYRCFKEGDFLEFKPGINLLVGDQGTGKSTLINLLTKNDQNSKDTIDVDCDKVLYFFFDFEKHNPRMKDRIETEFDIACRFSSHGELNLAILSKLERELKSPSIIVMDEVDMALSIRSCRKVSRMMRNLEKSGHQILAIVHNLILIQSVKDVLSIEHKKWMPFEEFVRLQTEE